MLMAAVDLEAAAWLVHEAASGSHVLTSFGSPSLHTYVDTRIQRGSERSEPNGF